uniref:Secreted protein n=1 Tax=Romanomermis culicivorax TaxID=13658 RepID=A0A915L5T2_ROMCU
MPNIDITSICCTVFLVVTLSAMRGKATLSSDNISRIKEYGKMVIEKPNLSDVILRRTVKNADDFQNMVADNTLTALTGSTDRTGQARMCKIEVQEIRKVPGHCIKLLGGMNACEGGGYMALFPEECQGL